MQVRANNKRRQGFTLAELMVVVVILGILATLVATDVVGFLAGGKQAAARTELKTIDGAIENYILRNGGAPDSLEQLLEKDANGHQFLKGNGIPKDPWDREYMYEPPYGSEAHRVYTYGRDGSPGGEGEDSDIDNASLLD